MVSIPYPTTALPMKPTRHDIYDFISPESGTKNAAEGKTVLITGAGSGVGEHTAIHFAMAGATSIILAGRDSLALEDTKNKIQGEYPTCHVTCVPTDITNPKAVSILFEKSDKVDVLVNNAGSTGTMAPLAQTDFEKWWQAFDVNVKGTYLVTCEFLKRLEEGPGAVINVSSRSSYVTAPGMSAYQTSKSALNRLTEYVDKDYSAQGVVAVAFHPGGVAGTKVAKNAPEWLRKTFRDTPALPAATAVYLTTPNARYLSGRFISAQWDMQELETHRERIIREDLLKMRVLGIDDHL